VLPSVGDRNPNFALLILSPFSPLLLSSLVRFPISTSIYGAPAVSQALLCSGDTMVHTADALMVYAFCTRVIDE
jgi:hypothetical protein